MGIGNQADEALVFVVDLTPKVMAACRAEIEDHAPPKDCGGPPPRPAALIQLVALLVDPQGDPLLLPIEPTDDVVMLDAMARLIRISLLYGRSFDELAAHHGDELVKTLYRERRFPSFIYGGLPAIRQQLGLGSRASAARTPNDRGESGAGR